MLKFTTVVLIACLVVSLTLGNLTPAQQAPSDSAVYKSKAGATYAADLEAPQAKSDSAAYKFAKAKSKAAGPESRKAEPGSDTVKPILVLNVGGHTSTIRSLMFTPDGRELISTSEDATIRFWS